MPTLNISKTIIKWIRNILTDIIVIIVSVIALCIIIICTILYVVGIIIRPVYQFIFNKVETT